MHGNFRAMASALRDAASYPETDLRLIGLMVATASDLEDAADADDPEISLPEPEIFLPEWEAGRSLA